MSQIFHEIKVSQIVRETHKAISVYLDIPEKLAEEFQYKQGQYLTLKLNMDGKEYRRSYSMSSSPLDDFMRFTVKEVENGKVSTWLNRHLKPGDSLFLSKPEGRFFTPLHPDNRKKYFLFGAGSGITPLMSIIKTTLEVEPLSQVFLLYGNKTPQDCIFKNELENLAQRFEGQFQLQWLYSRENSNPKKTFISSLFKNDSSNSGRINKKTILDFIDNYGISPNSEFFICGPGEMIKNTENYLIEFGINRKNIHKEYFSNAESTQPTDQAPTNSDNLAICQAKIRLDGQEHILQLDKGKTILQSLIEHKLDPPYSCTSGACSSCMAKLLSGEVKMDHCLALDQDEIDQGYILTCQAKVISNMVEITYEI